MLADLRSSGELWALAFDAGWAAALDKALIVGAFGDAAILALIGDENVGHWQRAPRRIDAS